MCHVVLVLNRVDRVFVGGFPAAGGNGSDNNQADDHHRQRKYPPGHRHAGRESGQPTIDEVVADWNGHRCTNERDAQELQVEHFEDRLHGGSIYPTDADLFAAVLGLEQYQAEYPHNRDHHRKQREDGDQLGEAFFRFVVYSQLLVKHFDLDRLFVE